MSDPASPWTAFHARLHGQLRSRELLPAGARILLAVSGGQDSLCLARVLRDLQPKWGWTLAIAHCDHRWRPDSAANAAWVGELADRWDLPFFRLERGDRELGDGGLGDRELGDGGLGNGEGSSADRPEVRHSPRPTEADARAWRYRVLADLALREEFAIVATGHTASDRAETLLYNLVRGGGSDGLAALTWRRELVPGVALVRPLLAVLRAETAEFCRGAGLSPWEDATNRDRRYARNCLRLEVLPLLRDRLNPQVERHLAQTAEVLRAEADCLDAIAADWLARAAIVGEPDPRDAPNCRVAGAIAPDGAIPRDPDRPTDCPGRERLAALDRTVLRQAPLAIQRRALRSWLRRSLPAAVDFTAVEKLVALLDAPNRSQSDPFPGGAIARVRGTALELVRRSPGA